MKLISLLFLVVPTIWGQCTGYATHIIVSIPKISYQTTLYLLDFPAPVTLTMNALKTVANGGLSQSTGNDIVISDINNNACHPLQKRDYNAATGYWYGVVKIPLVFAGAVTRVVVWVGKASVSDQSTTSVWTSDYKQVYPLQESTSPYLDATVNAKNSTGGTNPTRTTATLGYAQTYNGTTTNTQVANNLTTGSVGTFSAVIKSNSTSNFQRIYDNRASGDGCVTTLNQTTGTGLFFCQTSGSIGGTTNIVNNAYHHIMGVLVNSTTMRLYVDGVNEANATFTFNVFRAGTARIGSDVGGTLFMNGQIQEVRVSNAAKCSAAANCGWAQAEMLAMTSPSTFFVLGGQSYAF